MSGYFSYVLSRMMCCEHCVNNAGGWIFPDDKDRMTDITSSERRAQTQRPVTDSPRLSRIRISNFTRDEPVPVHRVPELPTEPPAEIYSEEIDRTIYTSQYLDETNPKEYNLDVSSQIISKHPQLDDYGSAEDLRVLTVRELKILLTINRVDFKGCIEKNELLDKVQLLWEDNNQNKDISGKTPTSELCKICMDAPLDCVLLECGHIASCVNCGKTLAECPICRQYVVRVVRIFKA